MDLNNFLDFGDILINELAGSVGLFIILAFVVLFLLSIYIGFSNKVTGILSIVLIAVIANYLANTLIWTFMLLFVGVLFYTAINRLMKR